MKSTCAVCVGLVLMVSSGVSAQSTLSAEAQIAQAVRAAPADRRGEATVLGWDGSGAFATLRQGTNELVCLADDPKTDGFSVACYHKDLEPFMARGRALTAQGTTDNKARATIRWQEIESGALSMSREPRMLYVLTGKSYDPATGSIDGEYLRWVIYVPFATGASTGLPLKGGPGVPWLMDPGTAGAHIMISPPRQ